MSKPDQVRFDRNDVVMAFEPAAQLRVREYEVANEQTAQEEARRQQLLATCLQSISNELTQARSTTEQLQREMLELVVDYCEAVATAVFSTDRKLIAQRVSEQIQNGIGELDFEGVATVMVHPDCEQVAKEIQQKSNQGFDVKVDSLLAVGDCRIQCPEVGLIARLKNQIEQARYLRVEQQPAAAKQPEGAEDVQEVCL